MDIIYLGHSSFKLTGKTVSIVTDPFDPEVVGLKFPKVSADILTLSHDHKDHSYAEGVTNVYKTIKRSGEYEIKGVSIIGIPSYHDSKKGEERGKNIIFVFEIDGLRVAHLGDLGHTLSDEVINEMGNIDILLVPCGGGFTIDAGEAVSVTQAIEPKIVIPMHYQVPQMNADLSSKLTPVETFTTALGSTPEILKKYSIKSSALMGEEMKLVILERS